MTLSHTLAEGPAEFSRALVERTTPIRFRLNGREIGGLAGDTVLTALIRYGVDSVGNLGGSPVVLDETTAPSLVIEGNEDRKDLAMPMTLCPARDGAHYRTLAAPRSRTQIQALAYRLRSGWSNLDLDLSSGISLAGSWIDTPPEKHLVADVVVVGAGIAGLSAAFTAAQRKSSVILIEKDARLGGIAPFFGKQEGLPPPQDMIDALLADLTALPSVQILTGTEGFALEGGTLEALRVTVEGGVPRPERLSIKGESFVLATGTEERLPAFPGNRLPGVYGSVFAWRLAALYAVWPGMSFHLHTLTGAGYRMAMLGADSGRTVNWISDPRPSPQTRFIDYSKAYGFRLSWGREIAEIRHTGKGESRLRVTHRDSERHVRVGDAVRADTVIVSGGWKPALSLWVRAGGAVQWNSRLRRLEPTGTLPRVALAGSACGWLSSPACVQSGEAAIAGLLGKTPPAIVEALIAPDFETPDAVPGLVPPSDHTSSPAYAGSGTGLIALPSPPPSAWRTLFIRRESVRQPLLKRALSPGDLSDAATAGLIDVSDLPALCAERCILPRQIGLATSFPTDAESPLDKPPVAIPAFLAERYGKNQRVWSLDTQGTRHFDPGCLIFANSDTSDPHDSLGTLIGLDDRGRPLALMAKSELTSGDTVFVRDGLSAIAVRLGGRVKMG